MLKVGVLASGRGSNLEALLKEWKKNNITVDIAVVISNKSSAKALQRAEEYGVANHFIDPKDYIVENDKQKSKGLYDKALVNKLKEYKVDLVVLAGYMKLITSELLNAFPKKIINIHPSLLPAFPGLDAQKQAVEYGVKYSGCTVHFVDEGMDSGAIIAQTVVPVLEEDTGDILAARILKEEHKLLPKIVDLIGLGKVEFKDNKVRIL